MRWFHVEPTEAPILPFIFTVTMTSAGQTFQLPTRHIGTYDFTVDWGDSSSDVITVWDQPERTHAYASPGVYDITISGTFRGWTLFNDSVNAPRITDIKQWGALRFVSGDRPFRLCSGFTHISASDAPVLDVGNLTYFFAVCGNLTSINNLHLWDVSLQNTMTFWFSNARNFNDGGLSNWNTDSLKTATQTFAVSSGTHLFNQPLNWNFSGVGQLTDFLRNARNYDHSMAGWDISNVTAFNSVGFLANGKLSTENYDATLIGWAAQPVNLNRSVNFGNSKYTNSGAALAARNTLVNTYGWTIVDGGPA